MPTGPLASAPLGVSLLLGWEVVGEPAWAPEANQGLDLEGCVPAPPKEGGNWGPPGDH